MTTSHATSAANLPRHTLLAPLVNRSAAKLARLCPGSVQLFAPCPANLAALEPASGAKGVCLDNLAALVAATA